MDEKLKRRLVGVAVLAVLAIIFVPMVLDGPDWSKPQTPNDVVADEQRVRVRLEADAANDRLERMPVVRAPEQAAPSATASSGQSNSGRASGGNSGSDLGSDSGSRPTVAATSNRIAPSSVAAEPSAAATSRAQAETAALRRAAESNRAKPANPKPATKPAAASQAAIDGSGRHGVKGEFLIQVGSFSSEANAKRLVKELVAKGWPAYHDQWQGRDRVLQRVRIGPLKSRDQADRLAQKVAESKRVKPRVMQID